MKAQVVHRRFDSTEDDTAPHHVIGSDRTVVR